MAKNFSLFLHIVGSLVFEYTSSFYSFTPLIFHVHFEICSKVFEVYYIYLQFLSVLRSFSAEKESIKHQYPLIYTSYVITYLNEL